jgi:hypothetical protein
MKLLSIDIGTRNCAFYIEEFDEKLLTLSNLFSQGKWTYWKVIDFSLPTDDIWINIIMYLDSHRHQWDLCNGIILEKQHKLNFKAQVVEHFIFSYYKNLYGPFKYIVNISATRKTQIFEAPKMNKKDRKKWAIEQAREICRQRGDNEGHILLSVTKRDDLADACLQLKAFQKMVFIQKKAP